MDQTVHLCTCTLTTTPPDTARPPAGAAPYNSFRRVTNPHMCDLGGVLLLGTSGQNIDDMSKYTRGQNR
jgi:DNA polymerase II small subunit/DNA polymerase delta subunit B